METICNKTNLSVKDSWIATIHSWITISVKLYKLPQRQTFLTYLRSTEKNKEIFLNLTLKLDYFTISLGKTVLGHLDRKVLPGFPVSSSYRHSVPNTELLSVIH